MTGGLPARYSGGMSTITTQKLSITRTYDRPVTKEQRLGAVPQDYYEDRGLLPQHGLGKVESFDSNEGGPVEVIRSVPVYNADGTPKMESVTETLEAESYDAQKRSAWLGALGAAASGAVAGTLAGGPIGTVIGALAGAAAGATIGRRTAEGDQLQECWETRDITHPTMNGYKEYTLPVPEFERVEDAETGEKHTNVDIQGYYHHHHANIEETKVGSFSEPEIKHSKKVGALAAGALTLGAGVALGVLAALIGRDD